MKEAHYMQLWKSQTNYDHTINLINTRAFDFQEKLVSQIRSQASREWPKSALYLKLKNREVFKIVKRGSFGLFETPVCWNKQN